MICKRGDVLMLDLPDTLYGTSVLGGTRPCIVVQNDKGNAGSSCTIVVPMTSKLKRLDLPTHVPLSWDCLRPGMAVCEQPRVVGMPENYDRAYLTHLPPQIMRYIDEGIRNAFFYGEDEHNGRSES